MAKSLTKESKFLASPIRAVFSCSQKYHFTMLPGGIFLCSKSVLMLMMPDAWCFYTSI